MERRFTVLCFFMCCLVFLLCYGACSSDEGEDQVPSSTPELDLPVEESSTPPSADSPDVEKNNEIQTMMQMPPGVDGNEVEIVKTLTQVTQLMQLINLPLQNVGFSMFKKYKSSSFSSSELQTYSGDIDEDIKDSLKSLEECLETNLKFNPLFPFSSGVTLEFSSCKLTLPISTDDVGLDLPQSLEVDGELELAFSGDPLKQELSVTTKIDDLTINDRVVAGNIKYQYSLLDLSNPMTTTGDMIVTPNQGEALEVQLDGKARPDLASAAVKFDLQGNMTHDDQSLDFELKDVKIPLTKYSGFPTAGSAMFKVADDKHSLEIAYAQSAKFDVKIDGKPFTVEQLKKLVDKVFPKKNP